MILRRSVPLLLIASLGSSAMADMASTHSISRFEVIIKHSPFQRFSDLAAAPSLDKTGNYELSGVAILDNVRKAWLRDNRLNKQICVGEGENVGEYRVVKIDTVNQSVVLSLGPDTVSLTFQKKGASAPTSLALASVAPPRPAYPNMRSAQPAATPTPAAPMLLTAVVPPTITNEQPATASPTSLRRRLLRQDVKTAQAPAQKEEAKEGEAHPAEETPAAQ